MSNDVILYNKDLCFLIRTINYLNLFTFFLLFLNSHYYHSHPCLLLFLSSNLFWSNPRKNFIRLFDYFIAIYQLLFHIYYSFVFNCHKNVLPIILTMGFLESYSYYFDRIKKYDLCIYFHSGIYIFGNIAIVIIYFN